MGSFGTIIWAMLDVSRREMAKLMMGCGENDKLFYFVYFVFFLCTLFFFVYTVFFVYTKKNKKKQAYICYRSRGSGCPGIFKTKNKGKTGECLYMELFTWKMPHLYLFLCKKKAKALRFGICHSLPKKKQSADPATRSLNRARFTDHMTTYDDPLFWPVCGL
jgi:hypothetical protein